jgi:hypothetical protein
MHVPAAVIRSSLRPTSHRVLAVLWGFVRYAAAERWAWASTRDLANRLDVAERSIRRALEELEEGGFVVVADGLVGGRVVRGWQLLEVPAGRRQGDARRDPWRPPACRKRTAEEAEKRTARSGESGPHGPEKRTDRSAFAGRNKEGSGGSRLDLEGAPAERVGLEAAPPAPRPGAFDLAAAAGAYAAKLRGAPAREALAYAAALPTRAELDARLPPAPWARLRYDRRATHLEERTA